LQRFVERKEKWDAKEKFLPERGQAQKHVSTHPYISFAPVKNKTTQSKDRH
jgi:hypothetical protein